MFYKYIKIRWTTYACQRSCRFSTCKSCLEVVRDNKNLL